MRAYIESLENAGEKHSETAWREIISKEIDDIKRQDSDAEVVDIDEAIKALDADGYIKVITMVWKIYGAAGHRQKQSFGESVVYNWTENGKTRIVEIIRQDRTGSNDYVIVRITTDSEDECESEFEGQLSDGIFENSTTGEIDLISKEETPEANINPMDDNILNEIIAKGQRD